MGDAVGGLILGLCLAVVLGAIVTPIYEWKNHAARCPVLREKREHDAGGDDPLRAALRDIADRCAEASLHPAQSQSFRLALGVIEHTARAALAEKPETKEVA